MNIWLARWPGLEMAVTSKTCAATLDNPKECRSLTGVACSTLCDLAFQRICGPPPKSNDVHKFLSWDPSFLCKLYHTTVTKYANFKQSLDGICSGLQSVLSTGGLAYKPEDLYLRKSQPTCNVFHSFQTALPSVPPINWPEEKIGAGVFTELLIDLSYTGIQCILH